MAESDGGGREGRLDLIQRDVGGWNDLVQKKRGAEARKGDRAGRNDLVQDVVALLALAREIHGRLSPRAAYTQNK